MISQALTPIVYVAVVLCWLCAADLIRIARRYQHIRTLSERAYSALALAAFMSLFAVALVNVDLGYPFFDSEGGRILVRLAGILPLSIPVGWWLRVRRPRA